MGNEKCYIPKLKYITLPICKVSLSVPYQILFLGTFKLFLLQAGHLNLNIILLGN